MIISLSRKAMALTNENENLIMICLKKSIDFSKPYLSESVIEKSIQKLQNYEHRLKNGSIGNYYLRHKVRFVKIFHLYTYKM